jgi:hypothetical protein
VRAESEDSTPIGRIDIRLLTNDAATRRLGYWAIIELKVLRTFYNAKKGLKATKVPPAENVKSMIEGLKQVHCYKMDRTAELGLLEVYDLRKSKAPDLIKIAEVKAVLAKCSKEIEVNIRPLYGSDKELRDSQVS